MATVSNVSDTARWVATYRAAESERPDALFKDPFARKLAGDEGRVIAHAMQAHMRNGWPIIVRTKLIDELVLKSIQQGCDRVLNLAAGLDTRPYRLELPAALTWIEADLPAIVDEKDEFFAAEKPACRVSREKVDLSDHVARAEFLDRATRGANKLLVITEGLLVYLKESVVRALSDSLLSHASVAFWMFDLPSPAIRKMMERSGDFRNAPLYFAPANGVAYFEALGWKTLEIESAFHHARRHHRLPPLLRFLAPLMGVTNPRDLGRARWSGIVRLGRL